VPSPFSQKAVNPSETLNVGFVRPWDIGTDSGKRPIFCRSSTLRHLRPDRNAIFLELSSSTAQTRCCLHIRANRRRRIYDKFLGNADPSAQDQQSDGQGGFSWSFPGEVTLGFICTQHHSGATIAAPVKRGFVLARTPNIKNLDGQNKIKLGPTDTDIRAVLNELERPVGGNEGFIDIWRVPSNFNWISGIAQYIGLMLSTAVFSDESLKYAARATWGLIAFMKLKW